MSLAARRAELSDYERFVTLFHELATGDPVPEQDRWAEAMAPATLLFENGGQVVAYAYTTALADVGYVRHLVVDPAHRGRGFGRAVMAELARRFRDAGLARWALNVKPDNAPALALYRGVGMRARYMSTALRLEWEVVDGLPEPVRPVSVRAMEPAEDAAIEDAFGVARGTLAASRRFPGRVVLRLVDPAAPAELRVGMASFNPQHPGSFPFRLADPTFARAMLEGIRPYALPRFSHVGVVVEDDAPLMRMLLAHGATAHLEIVHYEGHL